MPMAWTVPTYAEIRDRMLADCDEVFAASGYERGIVEYAILSAVAAAALLLYVTIAVVSRDNVPSRAAAYVMRLWAAFFGVIPKPATKHTGTATFAAATGAGPIPEGSSVRLRSGVEFFVDADASESGGFITVSLTAAAYGPAGRSLAGRPIFLGSPVGDVSSEGLTGDIAGGLAAESDANVLARLLDRLRDPPKGGTDADFKRWVKATPGVDVYAVWVRNSTTGLNLQPSSVQTLFAVVPTSDNGWSPLPTEIEVGLVQDYVAPFCPVDILEYSAKAVLGQALNPTIQLAPNTPTVQDEVTSSLRAALLTNASPGVGALVSQINEAISTATGETDHVLVTPASNTSAADVETIIVLGTPTYAAIP